MNHSRYNKIGIQTIIWGEDFDEGLESTLEQITELGISGVEFAQIPRKLGQPEKLESLLKGFGLQLLGLSGGSLNERLEFCKGLQTKPLYLYVQQWDQMAASAIASGYTLALHPHLFTPVDRFERVFPLLNTHTELKFLPDIGHLFLAGDNILDVLQVNANRIGAVHLKDWTPKYGWSIFTYARGFTELGCGILPLPEVVEWLQINYSGWIVLDQDSTEHSPIESIRLSLNWLNKGSANKSSVGKKSQKRFKPLLESQNHSAMVVEAFNLISHDTTQGVNELYSAILKCFSKLVDCKCATLWEASPRNDMLTLQSFWSSSGEGTPNITKERVVNSLSGLAVVERIPIYFEKIISEHPYRAFHDVQFLSHLKLESMISIPISNYSNINQPELLINLFPGSSLEHFREASLSGKLRDDFESTAKLAALLVERAWSNLRMLVIDEINWIAGSVATVKELLEKALDPILIHLQCESAAIFLVSQNGESLGLVTRSSDWKEKLRAFHFGEGPAGIAWKSRNVFNSGTDTNQDTHQRPGNSTSSSISDLIMPVFSQPRGEVIGVIWCHGKQKSNGANNRDFSVTDEIILDAVQAGLSPHLERMLAAEWRNRTMTRITHELKVPIVVTSGAAWNMEKEMRQNGWRFSEGYLEDVADYMKLMANIVSKASFLRPDLGIDLHRQRVLIFSDIVIPAVDYVKILLQQRNFSKEQIICRHIDAIPPMFLDKERFQQVVFNLLNNAVKYAQKDPAQFKVEIEGRHSHGRSELIFRDRGVGIDSGMEETIFGEGIRGPNAHEFDISGDGIGLWMAREILKAHGASIRVSHRNNPTEFMIFLPNSLQEIPAKNVIK